MKVAIYIDQPEILKRYKPVNSHTHKGIQGHALIIGGSYGKIGAVSLSSKACLKTGCGLVTVFIPRCGYKIVQTANPEVMVLTDLSVKYITRIAFDFVPQAIGIGPGIGRDIETHTALHRFVKTNKTPLVIDADALTILSQNQQWLTFLPEKTILTPHQKELERLIGEWDSVAEKFEKTVAFSKQNNFVIVMKGAPTYIIDGETIYKNTTGNAALATAGTGDVLTGMITSLLAQSYEPVDAAILGVYLHGLTADIALPKTGYQAFIASDVIKNIGKAYLSLEK
ncbi:NAD(P)H-hydrate dehydratase [Flavobacterium franklandianum]|uniref:ADP-dependent (S)-NAD(P)H-hydrate dehydratase n=1 Tax=Flavobacterium franklandianum TaxID=2594430 RepID=A0A553CNZ5_9FLAO|nr:NAD(P)H-hydrate dehydratase [Flavobacterium franklandianum]TRX22209.1 NAD(P)H-hydrate dehydratase [Flavobacterium franklandianum]TRX28945.1 NAD(P)H-hydrate dehydratase [Flavobacterium franklandianum]